MDVLRDIASDCCQAVPNRKWNMWVSCMMEAALLCNPVVHPPGALCYCSSSGSCRHGHLDADLLATLLADHSQLALMQGLQHGYAAGAPSGCSCRAVRRGQHLIQISIRGCILGGPTVLIPKDTYTLACHADIFTFCHLGAEVAGFDILSLDFQDFLPQLDTAFELEVSLAEVSDLPHAGLAQVKYECWAACCCSR